MNIWIINPYAVPPTLGGLNRHFYFKKYLERNGHKVTIFTSSSVYNRNNNLFAKNEKSLYKIIDFDGQSMVFVKTPSSKSLFDRLLAIHIFCKRVKNITKSGAFCKPDAIYSSVSPEIEIGILGNKLGKYFKRPSIIEIRDLYPDTLPSLGVLRKNGPIYKVMDSIFKKTFYKADSLVFTMDGGKQHIIDKKWDIRSGGKIDLSHVFIINNGVDIETFESQLHNNFSDSDLDNHHFKNIVYTGSMGMANDLDRILSISKGITDSSVRFLLWGDGKRKSELQKRIKTENITNVIIKDPIDGNYVPSLIKKSYITLMIQKDIECDSLYGISSNKSFQYLAAMKPIILCANAPFDNFQLFNPGIQIKNSDIEQNIKDFNLFLETMRNDRNYRKCCESAGKMAKLYDYKIIATVFEKAITKTIESYRK